MSCRIHPSRASLLAALMAVITAAPAAAQLHKDAVRGFQFKPPKDFKTVALQPNEHTVIAKYQDSATEHSADAGGQGFNEMFEVSLFPKDKAASSDAGAASSGGLVAGGQDDAADTPLDRIVKLVQAAHGNADPEKLKSVKLEGGEGREFYLAESGSPIKFYELVLQQDDGVFLFEAAALSQRFAKAVPAFAEAAKSFKRIAKADTTSHDASLSQMNEQDRFLQQQIDKLPAGWSSMRSKRYVFLYNADKNFVKELADRIEGMRDEYEKLYPPDKPITAVSIVRVCNSIEEYMGYGGPPGTGGYWNWVDRELVFFDFRPRDTTMAILNHEAFHQYIYYFYGQLSPHSWYNEGHGDYFAGAKMTKNNHISGFGDPPGIIGRLQEIKDGARLLGEGKKASDGAAAPLKQIMHFHQSEYYGGKGYPGGLCYAEGWSIVHMLRQSRTLDPRWQKILPDYLKNLLDAREAVATELMKKTLADADKNKAGSSADMSKDVKDYYAKVDEDKVQDVAYDKTFKDWTDDDWGKFQDFWLKNVPKIQG